MERAAKSSNAEILKRRERVLVARSGPGNAVRSNALHSRKRKAVGRHGVQSRHVRCGDAVFGDRGAQSLSQWAACWLSCNESSSPPYARTTASSWRASSSRRDSQSDTKV